jgi:hypothetical protein
MRPILILLDRQEWKLRILQLAVQSAKWWIEYQGSCRWNRYSIHIANRISIDKDAQNGLCAQNCPWLVVCLKKSFFHKKGALKEAESEKLFGDLYLIRIMIRRVRQATTCWEDQDGKARLILLNFVFAIMTQWSLQWHRHSTIEDQAFLAPPGRAAFVQSPPTPTNKSCLLSAVGDLKWSLFPL